MQITRKNSKYTCENSHDELIIRGEVTIDEDFRRVEYNGTILNSDDVELGHFTYNCNDGGIVDKRIAYLNKMYLNSIETLLDDTIDVLVLEFKLFPNS